jgi:hypothetical protein
MYLNPIKDPTSIFQFSYTKPNTLAYWRHSYWQRQQQSQYEEILIDGAYTKPDTLAYWRHSYWRRQQQSPYEEILIDGAYTKPNTLAYWRHFSYIYLSSFLH